MLKDESERDSDVESSSSYLRGTEGKFNIESEANSLIDDEK
jgi:hypothetical protein